MADIVERLRHRYLAPGAELRNPDGPEAADEIERLREALRAALLSHDIVEAEHPSPNTPVWVEAARAALREDRA
jgi:hypothetical protein